MAEEPNAGAGYVLPTLIKQAKELAAGLCGKYPELGQAGGALIFSRQIYRIARHEIHRMLEAHVANDDVRPYVEEILVQAWAEASDKGHVDAEMASTLISGLQGTVLPFVSNYQSLARRIQEDNLKDMSEAAEAERRASEVLIGFKYGCELDEKLSRQKTLCLVGRLPVLEYIMSEAAATALQESRPKQRVVHLNRWAKPNDLEDRAKIVQMGYLSLPYLTWKGAANSANAWGKLMEMCQRRLSAPIDLVIVDDVAECHTEGLVGGRVTYRADNAHKHIRRWADACGAAVLMGLVFATDPAAEGGPDLTSPAFEKLRTFTTLRPAWTKESEVAEGKTEVWIGKDSHLWVVSKEVVS